MLSGIALPTITSLRFHHSKSWADVAQEAEKGRDTKRRKHDMRELRPLQPDREERGRDRERPRNDERHSREERDRERYEW